MLKHKHSLNKLLSLALAVLMLSSCGLIEMREAMLEYPETNNTADGLLTPAARSVEDAEERITEFVYTDEPEATGPEPVTFTLAGDILVDTFIISDGARRAGEGQSYSFVRMLSGIYRDLSAADITAGFDTTAARPKNDLDKSHKIPEEMVAVLAEAGYDVLDTLAWDDPNGMLGHYGITSLSTSAKDGGILILKEKGLVFAICAAGGEAFPIGDEATLSNIAKAADQAELVIVLADWDDGMTHDEQCAAAYYMAEAGADVVVGTGETVGPVDRLATLRGTSCLVAYSLGSILSTGKTWEGLLGGILTFTATPDSEGHYTVGDPILTPTVVHFSAAKQDYQIFPLSGYNDDLAALHGVSGFTAEGLKGYIRTVIPAEYLPQEFRG